MKKNVLIIFSIIMGFFMLSGCSTKYEGVDFSFVAPSGFKVTTYEVSADPAENTEMLLFAQNKHVIFQIYRQKMPPVEGLLNLMVEHASGGTVESSHYQMIFLNETRFAEHDAVEYVYREFHGEPYVQNWEIWIDRDGTAYTLVCSEPVDSTVGAVIPIAEDCRDLVAGFQFKEN